MRENFTVVDYVYECLDRNDLFNIAYVYIHCLELA